MEMNNEHRSILAHTYKNHQKLFSGSSRERSELCEAGLMKWAGRKSFVPDPYYTITKAGIDELNKEAPNGSAQG